MKPEDPYLAEIHRNLPRLLALFDRDPYSPTRGLGDRSYWAWKVKDFADGTYQGAAHGLARLLQKRLLPPGFSEESALRRIHSMVEGTHRIVRRNGSLEEAYPHESSYCVTALVAHDLLSAIEVLGDRIPPTDRSSHLGVVAPMVGFLRRSRETHGWITNHLAVAACALSRWGRLAGEDSGLAFESLVQKIRRGQSSEGWFPEYEGADPGYQSLALHFLADLHFQRPEMGLLEPLSRSIQFLWHFAHPDGSFGGVYGSRATRFYFPGGLEALSRLSPEAAALAGFMRASIAERRTVTLSAVDSPNLVPMWNSYVWAACEARPRDAQLPELPCQKRVPLVADWPHAGLHVRGDEKGYSIVSSCKGGAIVHVSKKESRTIVDGGTVVTLGKRVFSTQGFLARPDAEVSAGRIVVRAPLTLVLQETLTPARLLFLRLANLTFLRSGALNALAKRLLVRRLITRKVRLGCRVERTIEWQNGEPKVTPRILGAAPGGGLPQEGGDFKAIHMASSGYWQAQDDA